MQTIGLIWGDNWPSRATSEARLSVRHNSVGHDWEIDDKREDVGKAVVKVLLLIDMYCNACPEPDSNIRSALVLVCNILVGHMNCMAVLVNSEFF